MDDFAKEHIRYILNRPTITRTSQQDFHGELETVTRTVIEITIDERDFILSQLGDE